MYSTCTTAIDVQVRFVSQVSIILIENQTCFLSVYT